MVIFPLFLVKCMSFGNELGLEVHVLLFKGWFLLSKLAKGL